MEIVSPNTAAFTFYNEEFDGYDNNVTETSYSLFITDKTDDESEVYEVLHPDWNTYFRNVSENIFLPGDVKLTLSQAKEWFESIGMTELKD